MSATYKAVYRCRHCGALYENGTQTGERIANLVMFGFVLGQNCPSIPNVTNTISMLDIHYCQHHDGSNRIGLADFQGFRIAKGENNNE